LRSTVWHGLSECRRRAEQPGSSRVQARQPG
jgi:hypothetical protein